MPIETNQEQSKDSNSSPRMSSQRQPRRRGPGRFFLFVLSYILVGLAVWQIAVRIQNDPVKQQLRAQEEMKALTKKVSSLIIVPENEIPQVAIIQDAEGLAKTQDFFVGIKNGDQILIYVAARKAIIYRPSENRIVNAGPVLTDNSQTTKNTQKDISSPTQIENSSSTAPAQKATTTSTSKGTQLKL